MTGFLAGLGRHPRTIVLALLAALGTVLVLYFLSAILPALANPLVLIIGAVVAFSLVLAH